MSASGVSASHNADVPSLRQRNEHKIRQASYVDRTQRAGLKTLKTRRIRGFQTMHEYERQGEYRFVYTFQNEESQQNKAERVFLRLISSRFANGRLSSNRSIAFI